MKTDMNDTKKIILERIQRGELTMRPRWHFVLRSILIFLCIAAVSVVTIYSACLFAFITTTSGREFIPMVALPDYGVFVLSSPWILLVLMIGFMATLEILVRKYTFGYRKPLLYTGLAIIGVISLCAYLISFTPTYRYFVDVARGDDQTYLSSMYQIYGERLLDYVYVGAITQMTTEGYILTLDTGETEQVIVDYETILPADAEFTVGDRVVVLGEHKFDQSEFLYAYGVKSFTDDETISSLLKKDSVNVGVTPSAIKSFAWSYEAIDISADYPRTLVKLSLLKSDNARVEKVVATVAGSCNEMEDAPLGALSSKQLLCYYAGFGYQFRIADTANGYIVERKEIEEASPDYNPPIGTFETFLKI
jgi:hypothetical protein